MGLQLPLTQIPVITRYPFCHMAKSKKNISLTIEKEHYITNLSAKLNSRQKIEIMQESNVIDHSINASEISETVKKPNRFLSAICKIFVVLILIFAIDLIFPKSSTSAQNQKAIIEASLTVEEIATSQLQAATDMFTNGNYIDAIEACNAIVVDFPDTDIAKNMGEYLETQYSQFSHFSAKDLVNEYDSNIVNADEKYTDKIIIVSGAVSAIGKTNNDRNLAVMLSSDTYFYGVQLNFSTSQTDSVAQLVEGDTVTAIGKCTGKSGKQFIIFDGNNVMIKNCYLISQ